MIKQSFLNSLEGLFLDQAEALIDSEGLTTYSVPPGQAITMIVRPHTIILWLNDTNQVESATAGDGAEVEDDT